MHDCPRCEAPLHDHETVCPRCGEKQYVPHSARRANLVEGEVPFNPVPLLLVICVIGAGLFFAVQHSWIGELITQPPAKVEAAATETPPVLRQMLQDKIATNLASVNAKGTFTWKQGDAKADLNSPQPVDLDIETQLSDGKTQRHMIIDSVKDLMDKANVTTITLNDKRSHATWTYSLSPPAADSTGGGDQPQ